MARSVAFKKGITLIELMVYMGVFTVLVAGVLYSAVFLAGIIEYNSFEYNAKEQIYRQLELLQHYASNATKIEINESVIQIFVDDIKIEQLLLDGELWMRYSYSQTFQKEFSIFPNTIFHSFTFLKEEKQNTVHDKARLRVRVERKDLKGRLRVIDEYLLMPKVDFSSIP